MDRKIETDSWKRKEICDFFGRLSNPFFSVTFRLDVTDLYAYAKRRSVSFYHALLYLCVKVMNGIEAFRYVLREDGVYLLDHRNPSFTDLRPGEELFRIITVEWDDDPLRFFEKARSRCATQKCFLDESSEGDDLVYISCLPWLDITSKTSERDFASASARNDSVPSVCFGKYVERDGRKELGVNVEVNHRLLDGYHVGQFARGLEAAIAEWARE